MMHFLLLHKLAKVPLKNCFRLATIIPGKCKNILLNKNVRTYNYIQCTCKYIPQGISDGFHVVPCGFRWFPMVPLGYTWLSTNQIYVKSIAHLQLSFPSFVEIFCSRG